LVSHLEDDPYQEMGRIQGKEFTIKALEFYKERVWQSFYKASSPDSPFLHEVQRELDLLFTKFKAEIDPKEEIDFSSQTDLHATIEVEQVKEVQNQLQQEQEINVNLNHEVEMELNRYAFSIPLDPYQERLEELDPSKPLWQQIKDCFEPQKLEDLFKKTYLEGCQTVTTASYAPCFAGTPLWATKNFYQTASVELPIFHPVSKRPGFLLAVQDDQNQYQFILVSEAEAAYYKNFLEKNKHLKAYLLDLKGTAEINSKQFNAQQDVDFKKEVQKGLWYANFFDGRIGYLEEQKDLSLQLIGKQEPLMARFLQLRIGKDSTRLRQLYLSILFNVDFSLDFQTAGHTFSWRRNKIEMKSQTRRKRVIELSLITLRSTSLKNLSLSLPLLLPLPHARFG